MNPLFLGAISEIVKMVVGRVWPDPEKQAQAQLELAKLAQAGELAQLNADLQLALGQMDINKIEAASDNVFVSGWRPFIGWTCGSGLAIQFVISPIATFAAGLFGKVVQMPSLDLGTLMTLLFGMLGLGAYRTYEKVKGTK